MLRRVLPWCCPCFAPVAVAAAAAPRPPPARCLHAVASSSSSSSSLSDDLKGLLAQRHLPVQRLDVDELSRYQARATFRDFVLRRFDLGILEAQGEESTVRRVVHAHLLLEEPQYRQLLASLALLPDPFGPLRSEMASSFQPELYRLTTSSQRSSHLAAATAGRAGIAKALAQLGGNVDKLRKEEEMESEQTDALRQAKIHERQGRVEELEKKLARFDALVKVLTAIEERLARAKAQVLERRRQWGGIGANALPNSNNVRLNSQAWGKAVEKEGREALEVALEEWRQRHPHHTQSMPFVLTGVTLQSLDSDEMLRLRHDITQQHAPLYDGTASPKAELDALVVAPTPEDPSRLQVMLAVEMKRSLDEVALDCLKFHLSLELCKHAPRAAIRFSSSSLGASKEEKRGWSTQGGYVLDFSSLRLPQDAIYLTKRGGGTLRATSKLMLEQVQLNGEGEEEEEGGSQVQQQFYAPEFVAGEDEGSERKAEEAREAAIDVLYERFLSHGVEKLTRRLDGVVRVLTGQPLVVEGGGEPPRLQNVFVLGMKEGDDAAAASRREEYRKK